MNHTRFAEAVSDATRLPLLAVPLFLIVGLDADGWRGLLWAILALSLTSGLSLLYLVYLVRSGRVRDPKRISRKERVRPLWTVAGLHAAAWVLVTLLGAPVELRAVLLAYAFATAAFALLTPVINISLHAAGVTGATMALVWVFGAWGVAAALLIPPVWWARITLKRHTVGELALGTLVGGGFTWLAFYLLT